MSAFLPRSLMIASILFAGHASATLTVYSRDDFRGARAALTDTAPDFRAFNFNDRASSLVVEGEPWEVCKETGFRSRCVVLAPGSYPDLASMGLDDRVSSARPVAHHHAHPPRPSAPVGDIVFFEDRGFHGRGFGLSSQVHDLHRRGYNDRASSVMVFEGRWEVCEHANFSGRCVLLRPGRYPDLAALGLNDRLSTVRRLHRRDVIDDDRGLPAPLPVYDWRRRPSEVLVQVPVESVRAVYASPQQQCWVEQPEPTHSRVAGAVLGGVIGGILGHQIGEGGGRDVATAGGAVVGAVIGSQVARGAEAASPVTRCSAVPSSQGPDYYEVTYRFEGVRHHVQSTLPPGPTIVVNGNGEPRL
ncbi:beta/gamma crystallin-related protein [Aquabacterium sp. A7-Y]|uniref:beta/gamma crystallin-related protein n=1 Tax=Aquabacterium sp. A7-Y TaxID=1349605 RepID=UPI00223DDD04|nr:beta/gamma crystallin-related protein [Aquabacterium sp. A7-Y]MCW7540110.1 beta/gamma crystallin-related protein [Aquabacterium sp. A7-Y]